MDVYNKNIKSIGHHMVCYNKNKLPNNWYNYDNCIQINNLRNFDKTKDFQRKYPFATIHFLLALLSNVKEKDNILNPIFCGNHSFLTIMEKINDFLR